MPMIIDQDGRPARQEARAAREAEAAREAHELDVPCYGVSVCIYIYIHIYIYIYTHRLYVYYIYNTRIHKYIYR